VCSQAALPISAILSSAVIFFVSFLSQSYSPDESLVAEVCRLYLRVDQNLE